MICSFPFMQITIGVAYKEMERKGSDDKSRLGHNAQSWSLYWSGTGFSFWHNNQEKLLGSPKAKRIGIYLDQHTGILNFYSIINKQAFLIHHHETQFHGPLYPGFRMWAGIGDTLTICHLDWVTERWSLFDYNLFRMMQHFKVFTCLLAPWCRDRNIKGCAVYVQYVNLIFVM